MRLRSGTLKQTQLMYQTLVQGDKSNSHIGLYGSLYLHGYLTWNLIFYADDLHFNDIVNFNCNTRWKFVLQSALSWSPVGRIFKDLGLEYTMVTPYTYTHPAHSYDGVKDLAYSQPRARSGPAGVIAGLW